MAKEGNRSQHRYADYMTFPGPVDNPWTPNFLNNHLRVLGVRNPTVTMGVVDSMRNCYAQQPNFRVYHGPDHAAFVGTPHVPEKLAERLRHFSIQQAESLLAIGGLWHDTAYKHVDAFDGTRKRAWTTALENHIDGMAEYSMERINGRPIFTTHLTDIGKSDAVTQMVAGIFNVGNDGILHNQGGNEFDSALAAAKFLEKQEASAESIVAVTTLIAGTVPFRKSVDKDNSGTIVGDGYMGELAKRLREAKLTIGDDTFVPDKDVVNDIMMLTVHMANRDIAPFIILENAPWVIKGARELKEEDIPELRAEISDMSGLVGAASRQRSSPLLYSWLRNAPGIQTPVQADDVPSIYFPRDENGNIAQGTESYPPIEIYNEAVNYTRENTDPTYLFFQAHEVGISYAAAIATLIDEPNGPVPGIVESRIWEYAKQSEGILNDKEQIIYDELLNGTHQIDVDTLITRRSPIAATIFGIVGTRGIEELSGVIDAIRTNSLGTANPFDDTKWARGYFDAVNKKIGEEGKRAILTELIRVARHFVDDPYRGNKDRESKLEKLFNESNV